MACLGHDTRSPLPNDVRDRLQRLQEILCREITNVTPSHATPPHATPLPSPVPQLISVSSQLISKSCTKMVVLFSRPPFPTLEECEVVSNGVEQATLHLITSYHHLCQRDLGRTLILETKSNVLNILQNIKNLVIVLIKEGTSSSSKLHGMGSLWESCEVLEKMSKDNKTASTKIVLQQLHLIQDARVEAEQTYRQLVTHGEVSSTDELDCVAEGVCLLSPLVDDLLSDLPHPVNTKLISQQAESLGDCLIQFINVVDSCQFAHHGNSSHSNSTTVETIHYRDIISSVLSKLIDH